MIKYTILLVRNPALKFDDFVRHHKEVHAKLFMSVPVVRETVRRYVQQHSVPIDVPGLPLVRFDGITELWFDDIEALSRCFSDTEYLVRVRSDEVSFLDFDACEFVISRENIVAG